MSTTKGLRTRYDSDEEDDEMSQMASPVGIHGIRNVSRGRGKECSEDVGRGSSRSRSRSSSVLRRIIGRGSSKKKSDDGMSVTSGMTSVASNDTKNLKFKRIKTIRKSEGSSRRSSSCDPSRSSSCDRTRSSSCDRTRSSSKDGTRSRSRDRPHHNSFSGPVDVEDETTALDKKLRKKSKLKYKSRRVNDSGGVDSDGDYGAADSDGDAGSIDGGRSVGSEGILSSRRKVRRKKRPKKSNYADDETLGSSKASLADSIDYRKSPRMSTKDSGTHGVKVAAIQEPPMSPEGAMLKNEMDSLFPSPKSEKKKLPRVKRKGKPDISLIAFEKEEFSPIVDRTPGARPSDYRKSRSKEMEAAAAALKQMTDQDARSTTSGRPPLPDNAGDADTAGSWRMENVGHWRKNGKGDASSINQYSQNNDSGLSIDVIPQDMPSSNRSNKSLRSYGKGIGDNDTVLSMTDTMSSLSRQLEDQREETRNIQKQLTEALSKVASVSEELRLQEGTALRATVELAEITAELGRTQDKNSELHKMLDDMKDDLLAKDERIEKLQQVVETQLDTVEFLEDRLEQTEDELFKMEDELKALNEEGLLDQSVHTKSLLKRKESIQQEMVTRKGSIRVQTQESRSVLCAGHNMNKRLRSVSTDDELEQREAKIVARERKLDEWEKNLVKIDVQLKQESQQTGEEASAKIKLQLMEKRERRMEENRDALLQEKEELLEKVRLLEHEKNTSFLTSSSDEELTALKCKIQQLESRNKSLLIDVAELQMARASDASRVKELESDKQDLRVKLDHVRSTAIKDEEDLRLQIQSLEEDLRVFRDNGGNDRVSGHNGLAETIQKLREEMSEKDSRISVLENKLRQTPSKDDDDEDEGKDLLIRELQNQLVAAKKEAHDLSSGDHVKRLKAEIKTLKQGYNDVKKRMKSAEINAQGALKKKDESVQAMKSEVAKLQRDLERLEKREKNLRSDGKLEEGDLQKHIEDLEDEIDHWKATNTDLENELEQLKAEFNDHKKDQKNRNDDGDDDGSVGSLQSLNSYMSEQRGMEMSNHSVSSGLFFVSDSTSVRNQRSINVPPPPPGDEPSTPSQRALRSVSSLWSKMRNEPNHPASNPAIPYGAGILDDD